MRVRYINSQNYSVDFVDANISSNKWLSSSKKMEYYN